MKIFFSQKKDEYKQGIKKNNLSLNLNMIYNKLYKLKKTL